MLYDLFKEWLADGGIQTRTSQKDEKYSVETERDSATAKARDGKGDSGRDVYTKKWARERPHKWDRMKNEKEKRNRRRNEEKEKKRKEKNSRNNVMNLFNR